MRRLASPVVLGAVLLVATFAGCLGDDVVEAPSGAVPAEDVAEIARASAEAQAGTGELVHVAAFSLVPRASGAADGLPMGGPALAGVAEAMASRVQTDPADGRSTLWGHLFRSEADGSYILVTVDTAQDGAAAAGSPRANALALPAEDARLLGAQASIEDASIDSAAAVSTAQQIGEWARTAGNESAFVLMTLVADSNGTATWNLVAAQNGGVDGFLVRVDAATGVPKGAALNWPPGAPREEQVYNSGLYELMLPEDTRTFTIEVPERAWDRMHVQHRMTGNPIGSPAAGDPPSATLTGPAGTTAEVPFEEIVVVGSPEPGDWEFVIEYTWPTSVRSARVTHCLVPVPTLLSPEPSCDIFD